MDYFKVANAKEILSGQMKMYEIEGLHVTIANVEARYYAFGDRCPHMNAPLHEGHLDGKVLTCPLHHSTFDVTTGKKLTDPNIPIPKFMKMGRMMSDIEVGDLTMHEIKIENDEISVSLEPKILELTVHPPASV